MCVLERISERERAERESREREQRERAFEGLNHNTPVSLYVNITLDSHSSNNHLLHAPNCKPKLFFDETKYRVSKLRNLGLEYQ